MSTITATPDIEYALREWIKGRGVAGASIYFGVPDDVPSLFVTLARIGGSSTPGTAGLDEALVSFSVWGSTKKEAGDAARKLKDELSNLEAADIGNGVHVYGVTPELFSWRPDPETSRPRYIVDVRVYARTTT